MSEQAGRDGSGATRGGLRLGAWARSGELVGVIAKVTDSEVTLFSPGERRMLTAPAADVELVPAGAVRVTATVDLPLAHGMGEDLLRRWVAALLDETLRERAYSALRDAGLDEGAALPGVAVSVRAAPEEHAVCLCGATTPAATGAAVACASCGRQAVAPPTSAGAPPGAPPGASTAGGPLDDLLGGADPGDSA